MYRVLALPELLASIILQMPIVDILVNAQRVNRTWHGVIQNTPELQQALFFRPVPLKPFCFADPRPHFSIPASLSDHARQVYRRLPAARMLAADDNSRNPAIMNNPLLHRIAWLESHTDGDAFRIEYCKLITPEASWRRMYLSQPPTEYVGDVEDGKVKQGLLLGDMGLLALRWVLWDTTRTREDWT